MLIQEVNNPIRVEPQFSQHGLEEKRFDLRKPQKKMLYTKVVMISFFGLLDCPINHFVGFP